MNDEQQIIDNAPDLRRWRIELPNLYDDSKLDPYEFRLLAHYKRVGTCWETVRTTAETCCMSPAQVSIKRKSLADKGFISITDREDTSSVIEVIDRWAENFSRYCLPHERACLSGKQARLPRKPKNKHIKNQPEEEVSADKPRNDSQHPAIQAYRLKAKTYPDKAQFDTIIQAVGESDDSLAFWGEVVKAYVDLGWNKRNIGNMVSFFQRHELPRTNGGARPINGKSNMQIGLEMAIEKARQNGIV